MKMIPKVSLGNSIATSLIVKACCMIKLLIVCFFLTILNAAAQPPPRNVKRELSLLKGVLTEHHIEPKKIDDAFSSLLFEKVLNDLDPKRIFFTASDIRSLGRFRNQLDDEVNGVTTGFLDELKSRYRAGLERSEKLISTTMASLDWQISEVYDPQVEWVADMQALADRHKQWLKYEVLERMMEVMRRDTIVPADFFQNNIAHVTTHVEQEVLRSVRRLLKNSETFENDVCDTFLHAMAGVFDPHSDFFSSSQYKTFVAALSDEDYYFGFVLEQDGNGNVVISALAPGGAAWKSGALHVSDVLLSLQWQDQDAIDVRNMDIDDVNAVLEESEGEVLKMTVRSVDGTEKAVELKKEKLASDENVVQSFILNGPVKTGYIYLPDFYTHWQEEGSEGSRCANDVAKEIIRLKSEGIEGLILDLRYNGGGSLFEAQAMGGIFIDEGPLAMMTTKDKKPASLKDMNRGTVYDGPLIVMVNGASASASEVLAATIQDYNRGLIVGSRTYGKATGQSLFPVGSKNSGSTGGGYAKITTQRLYRVTGKSAQGVGIVPDVELPDVFRILKVKENLQPFAMPPDSIKGNAYFKPMGSFDKDELRRRSMERVSNDAAFQGLVKTILWFESEVPGESEPQTLDWPTYMSHAVERRKQLAVVDSVRSAQTQYEVSEVSVMHERLTVDDYARRLHERWRMALASDIYLQESYQILRDYLSITKKP